MGLLWALATVLMLLPGLSEGAEAQPPQNKAWVNDVAVSLCQRFTTEEAREAAIRDYDPDLIDWSAGAYSNAGRWFTMRGVRVAGGAHDCYFTEIQRYHWIVPQLEGNGLMILGPEGKRVYCARYDILGLCANAPKTRAFSKQGLLANASFVDAVCQDNLGIGGCCCEWCARKFEEYLRSKYSPDALREMGVSDAGTLDLKRLSANARLQRAYQVWSSYILSLDVFGQAIAEVKEVGRHQGKALPFYGNISNHFGSMPGYLLNAQLVDVVWLEATKEQPQYEGIRSAWSALGYKVCRGAGNFEKPTWAVCYTYPPNALLNAHADAAANGAFINDPPRKTFARFIHAHRSLFLRREALARVAVVWSWPSKLFDARPESLRAVGTVLENAHIPYEVIIFGHPELWDDRKSLARLSRYDALILPEVGAVTEQQAQALRRFVDADKGLVVIGDFGTRNEEGEPRATPALPEVCGEGRHTLRKARVVNVPLSTIKAYLAEPGKPVAHDANFAALRDDILWAVGGETEVRTTAPETVWLDVWEGEGRKKLAVHLVNYDIDAPSDVVKPPKPFGLSLRLPKGFLCDRVRFIPLGAEAADLTSTTERGWLRCTVPPFDIYSIVVITSSSELEAADAIAEGRKLLDRLSVASGTKIPSSFRIPDSGFRLLREAQRKYDAFDFKAALNQATEAVGHLREALEQAIRDNVRQEHDMRQARLNRVSGAVRAFDFGAGPAAPGFKQVTASTLYTPEAGFGWQRASDDRADIDRKGPDDLHREFVTGRSDAAFLIDLPNGRYRVALTIGDTVWPSHPDMPCTWCDGLTNVYRDNALMLMGVPERPDVFEEHAFIAEVRGGQLSLTLQRRSRGPWQINGLLVEPAEKTRLLPQDELRRAALRDWLVMGPFDDANGLALTTLYPPEQAVDPGKGCQDSNGFLRWLHYAPQSGTGFCRVGFDRLFYPNDETMAYAVTHIRAPQRVRARLLFGSTGCARVWLNGRQIVRDEKTDGLRPDEYVVQIALQRGWNRLLVKVCHNWFKEWAFAASLVANSAKDQAGLEVSALGERRMLSALRRIWREGCGAGSSFACGG